MKRKNHSERRVLGPGSRLFGYMRDSGADEQELSIAQQRAALERMAADRGWVITRWFVDEAISGASSTKRDAFMDLVYECTHTQPPPVDGVLSWSLSRFGRGGLYDSYFYSLDLRRHGVQLVSKINDFPVGPDGELLEAVTHWANQKFLDELRAGVQRAVHENASQGFAQGNPPAGYKRQQVVRNDHRNGKPRVGNRWVVDHDKAPAVVKAFEMRAAGYTLRDIMAATRLHTTNEGYSTMFRCRTYIGVLTCGEAEYPGTVEPIIDQDLWQAVQTRYPYRQHSWKNTYLLSGLLRCGHCGATFSGQSGLHGTSALRQRRGLGELQYRYYVCNNTNSHGSAACVARRARADEVEALVLADVHEVWLQPRRVRQSIEVGRQAAARHATDHDVADLERRLAKAKAGMSNLLGLVEEGDKEAEERYRLRRTEVVELEAQLADRYRSSAAGDYTDQFIEDFCKDLRSDLESNDQHVVRRALRRLIDHAVYTYATKHLDIHYQDPIKVLASRRA